MQLLLVVYSILVSVQKIRAYLGDEGHMLMPVTQPVEWLKDRVRILDQTRLPWKQVFIETQDYHEVARIIREMRVRGAPAIGITGAYGAALAALAIETDDRDVFTQELSLACNALAATRPTAVNLRWALNKIEQAVSESHEVARMKALAVDQARTIHEEEEAATRSLSDNGASLVADSYTIMTHCNAGTLATGGYGTALGVIKAAHRQGKQVRVMATETRPLLQGARLTAWELLQEDIPVTVLADSAAGYFMASGIVDCVIVGADRVAANGDVANKVGTYALAILATENGVPFYVAAPLSTIDLALDSGDGIIIEERSPDELTHVLDMRIVPEGVNAANPAFDITPGRYVTAIITEAGVVYQPYRIGLTKAAKNTNDPEGHNDG